MFPRIQAASFQPGGVTPRWTIFDETKMANRRLIGHFDCPSQEAMAGQLN